MKVKKKGGWLIPSLMLIAVMVGMSAWFVLDHKDDMVVVSEKDTITEKDFLKADGKNLKNQSGQGDVVNLRGTNAGGYLLQEFWMTPTADSTNVHAESDIYRTLTERFGEEKMMELVNLYQDHYFTENDFANCAVAGMNCIRLPFWYRNLVDENGEFYGYDPSAEDPYGRAFQRLDWFVEKAGCYGMYVILDMHGAPGSQNGSDHSGVDGGDNKLGASAFFFGKEASDNQELYYHIWEVIAQRYAGNPVVAGYDLLNEPFCTYRYDSRLTRDEQKMHQVLWDIYDKAYQTIRAVDPDHVIIMEAVWDPSDLPDPQDYQWENIMYEYHNYLYDDYDNAGGQQIANMQKKLDLIDRADYNVPSYMGEFSYFNNLDAWDEGLELLTSAGINWTTWTYKTVSEYGNWGLYNHPVTTKEINVESADYEDITTAWSSVGEALPNEGLLKIASLHFQENVVAR